MGLTFCSTLCLSDCLATVHKVLLQLRVEVLGDEGYGRNAIAGPEMQKDNGIKEQQKLCEELGLTAAHKPLYI